MEAPTSGADARLVTKMAGDKVLNIGLAAKNH
jgi:hypothetical protein